MSDPSPLAAETFTGGGSGSWEVVRRLVRARLPIIGLILLVVIVAAVIAAPYITSHDPLKINARSRHLPPSWEHPFGTDSLGRDVFARVLYGARVSLLVGLTTIAVRLLIGVPLGLVAGYYGGRLDSIIMRVTDVFLSIPEIMLALVIVAIRGPSFWNIVFALSARGWTGFARLVRAEALKLRSNTLIEAVRSLGASDFRVIVKHLLPQMTSTLIVYTSLNLAWPILMEATLSFLGLGFPPPTPTLGGMLAAERAYLVRAWWAALFPGLFITVTVLSLNVLGDGLRDALDPEMKDE